MTINGYKIFDQIGRPHYMLVDRLSIVLYRDLTLDIALVNQCLKFKHHLTSCSTSWSADQSNYQSRQISKTIYEVGRLSNLPKTMLNM